MRVRTRARVAPLLAWLQAAGVLEAKGDGRRSRPVKCSMAKAMAKFSIQEAVRQELPKAARAAGKAGPKEVKEAGGPKAAALGRRRKQYTTLSWVWKVVVWGTLLEQVRC